MATFEDIAKDINNTKWMLIVFYCLVWCGASIQLLTDVLPASEGFWEKVLSWIFGILFGGLWPLYAGVLLTGAPN